MPAIGFLQGGVGPMHRHVLRVLPRRLKLYALMGVWGAPFATDDFEDGSYPRLARCHPLPRK